MKPKYSLVGGSPAKQYTGTTTFLSISVLGVYYSLADARQAYRDKYTEFGGLGAIIDLETGKEVAWTELT